MPCPFPTSSPNTPSNKRYISEDKPWPQIVIDRVDTGISTWDKNPSPHPMMHILNTLHAGNLWFTNIKIKRRTQMVMWT
jgi:hypothetical protein